MGPSAAPEVQILHIDTDAGYVAVNKPSGMLVHRNSELAPNDKYFVKDETRKLLLQDYRLDVPVFVVHRLDRATSGVMLFALHSSERAADLQRALQDCSSTQKQYWALTRIPTDLEMPESWTNSHPLKDLSKGKRSSKKSVSQPATTDFVHLRAWDGKVDKEALPANKCLETPVLPQDENIDSFDELEEQREQQEPHRICVVRALLHSGRRHQIRRHLANERYPVLGDTTYGKGRHNREIRRLYGLTRLALHSRRLTFREPGNDEGSRTLQTIEAPVPYDLRCVLCNLPGFDPDVHGEDCDLGIP